jgi:hypothetical protein
MFFEDRRVFSVMYENVVLSIKNAVLISVVYSSRFSTI